MSLRPDIYVTLERHCRANGTSISAFVEHAIALALRVAGAQMVAREDAIAYLDAKRRAKSDDANGDIAESIFTW